MSFSSIVKDELANHNSSARHCQLAELAAFFWFHGNMVRQPSGNYILRFQTENARTAKKCFTLLKKTFNIGTDVFLRIMPSSGVNLYTIVMSDPEDVKRLVGALKLDRTKAEQVALLTAQGCCKRAFIRGAFLAAGSISDPQKSYHLEMVCTSLSDAQLLRDMLNTFFDDGHGAKIVSRKKYQVVYIKDGAQIVDALNVMGAHVSLMEMENLRVVKEVRNSINRRVNCEAANINKTVSAAQKQVRDIQFIKDQGGFSSLSDPLREMAELRLEYPDVPLKELGELLDPPVGKSGVNHRLRKLCEIAQSMRDKEAFINEE